jgi:hypothetical protein
MYGFSRRLQAREEDAWIDFQNQTKNHPPEGLGVFDLTGFPEMLKLEEKYLTQEELDKYSAPSLGCMIRTRGAKGRSKKDTDRRHTRCMHVASPP